MLNDNIRDAQKKGLISIELNDNIQDLQGKDYDAQAELEKLSIQIIRQMKLIESMMMPTYLVPVFDGQYVQQQDRPWLGIPRDRYLVQDKNIERN